MEKNKKTAIIFFHGFMSSDKTDKFVCINHKHKYCTNINYIKMKLYEIDKIYDDLIKSKYEHYDEIILIGHSLGGFYANKYAVKYGCKAILLAPCLKPYKYIGSIIKRFRKLVHFDTTYTNNIIFFIEIDDEILDWHDIYDIEFDVNNFNYEINYMTKGSHIVCRKELINEILNKWIN